MTDLRLDNSSIILPPKPELTREGFLRAYFRIAKVGDLTYASRDGKKRVERVSEDVLFHPESLDSFATKPITYLHPKVMVDPDNSGQYLRGLTSHFPVRDGNFLGFAATVTHRDAIDAILKKGIRQASCGYLALVSATPTADGVYPQLKRDGNHVAICPAGRAGGEVRFLLDAEDEGSGGDADSFFWQIDGVTEDYWSPSDQAIDVLRDIQPNWIWALDGGKVSKPPKEATKMTYKATLDGIEYTFDSLDVATAVRNANASLIKLRADNESLETKLATEVLGLKVKLDAAIADAESVRKELRITSDQYDQTVLDLADANRRADARSDESTGAIELPTGDALGELIGERIKLWTEVLPVLRRADSGFEPDYSLTPQQIMAETVKSAFPQMAEHIDSLNLGDVEAQGFIKGMFSTLKIAPGGKANSRQTVDGLMDLIRTARNDGMGGMIGEPDGDEEIEIAKKKRAARIKNAGIPAPNN